MRLFQAVISRSGMPYLDAIGMVAQSGIKRIVTNDTGWCKSGGNTAKTIVRGGQEQVLFNHILFTYPYIIRQFGGNEYTFTLTQCPCGFIFNTVTATNDSVKELERIGILYH